MSMESKRCSKCGEIKPVSEFSKNKSKKDGLQDWCKTCLNEGNKRYYEDHKDDHVKRVKNYRRCVKNPTCPAVGGNGAKFVVLTCPICGIQFRKRQARVDYNYQKYGQTHNYCSRACHQESRRKSHETEYSKKIKQLRKTHGV